MILTCTIDIYETKKSIQGQGQKVKVQDKNAIMWKEDYFVANNVYATKSPSNRMIKHA